MDTTKEYAIRDFDPPLLIITERIGVGSERGVIGCGYLDAAGYSDLAQVAVVLRGVTTFEALRAKPVERMRDISHRAYELGVRVNMTGAEVLDCYRRSR